ncbi:MAG: DUF1902 domain-containing protein [Steroidobacteraceae bacterium]
MVEFTVTCEWDNEATVWYVSESNVPGLTAEAPTQESMEKLLDVRIPELLRLNRPDLFSRDGPRHVPFDLHTRRQRELNLACA